MVLKPINDIFLWDASFPLNHLGKCSNETLQFSQTVSVCVCVKGVNCRHKVELFKDTHRRALVSGLLNGQPCGVALTCLSEGPILSPHQRLTISIYWPVTPRHTHTNTYTQRHRHTHTHTPIHSHTHNNNNHVYSLISN